MSMYRNPPSPAPPLMRIQTIHRILRHGMALRLGGSDQSWLYEEAR